MKPLTLKSVFLLIIMSCLSINVTATTAHGIIVGAATGCFLNVGTGALAGLYNTLTSKDDILKNVIAVAIATLGGPIVTRLLSGSDGKGAALTTDLVVSTLATYNILNFLNKDGNIVNVPVTALVTLPRFIVYLLVYAIT